MNGAIDITPTPRILRTLGEIPFEIWQCFAELCDNSLDSFLEQDRQGLLLANARVDIYWSSKSTPESDREIIVEDNGPGMSLEQLQNAARAGFSNNDPINNLGLFGMGFNISTARLGDETTFVSATKESSNWMGIKIDFDELIKNQSFTASVVSIPKDSQDECGTRVIVKKLKNGVYSEIQSKLTSIRKRLGVIYAPILDRNKLEIYIQGKKLQSIRHCVWSKNRFVMRKREKIHAIQEINRDLKETWFDKTKNRYLSADEASEYDIKDSKGEHISENLVKRPRRLKGWVGIQRYFDTDNFGIDFVRNGRKILVGDKQLFKFENPELGTHIIEYPIELGSTVGGRIVGEINVDYLIPTYQKNAFDTTDIGWRYTVEALRGAGPILPQKRILFGYDGENTSPLGRLINAYRRTDPGTKSLSLKRTVERDFLKCFKAGDPDYIEDEKWYKAAQEADQENRTLPADPGDTPTDDLSQYRPSSKSDTNGETSTSSPTDPISPQPPNEETMRDNLIKRSERIEQLSQKYKYDTTPPLSVTAWKTVEGTINITGRRMPFAIFTDGGINIDYFYDETHSLLAEYPITPKQLLIQALVEKFVVRDEQFGATAPEVFIGLVENYLSDERINSDALKRRAQAIINHIQEFLPSLLASHISRVKDLIKLVDREEEALAETLLHENPNLLKEYQKGSDKAHEALAFIPTETLIRLVEQMPEEFLDDKVFTLPYTGIEMSNKEAEERLRKTSMEKITNYLRDAHSLLKGGDPPTKHELIRYSNTLAILEVLVA